MIFLNCFKCGSDEHLYAACPERTPRRKRSPAAAPAAPAAQEGKKTPLHPPVADVLMRRAPEEIADYTAQADRTRRLMGWSPDQQEQQRREKALAQVAESRAARGCL